MRVRSEQLRLAVLTVAFLTLTPVFNVPVTEGKVSSMANQQRARVRAPEISGGRGWLNTDRPLSLAGLKGKIVLLDFWTYGCINCIHIIPDLKKLEEKYPNQLVVIGVHSAKFDNEKETENIRRIILRYEIEHPVYNDAEFAVWKRYGIRAWPTQVLIDPAGYVIGAVSGEGNYDVIDEAIAKTIDEFRTRDELDETPLQLTLERAKVGDLPLAFPGKILADDSDRLFIADSNHNRIIIIKLDGTLLETIGTGDIGAVDAAFDKSSFYRPQGMALDGDFLYVADTGNHLIRQVDLKRKTVEKIAGTGKQSREYFKKGPARAIDLSSPWDLHLTGRTLYIAMAGPHQIWKLDLEHREISTFAGSGREARLDGTLLEAGFAQPSGLTIIRDRLYVADSESNIIRSIHLNKGRVETLVGGDLFEFGDVDGVGDEVRLQHPLGICAINNRILIADTYNHKIKELNPGTRAVKTLFGTGKPGQRDGKSASFYEPGGLAVANGKLYVADTNNHAIRVIDLSTRQTTTLLIKGLEPPEYSEITDSEVNSEPNAQEIELTKQRVQARAEGKLKISVGLPVGYHLNPAAPQRYRVVVENGSEHLNLGAAPTEEKLVSGSSKDLKLPLLLPYRTINSGQAELRVQLTLIYCREDNTGICRIKTLIWKAPIEVTDQASAGRDIFIDHRINDLD